MADRSVHPVDWLRGIALSIERLAVEGVASGAVRGAADELRSGLPEDLGARLRAVLQHALTVLDRSLGEAAQANAPPLETWARATAEGAIRGALEEYRRLVPEMQPTTQELLARVRLWLEHSATAAEARAQEIRAPGDRARILAAGAIAGAAEQLTDALPRLAEPTAQLASRVGRELLRGTAEELGRQLRSAARSRTVRALGFGGAIVVALCALRRR